MKSICTKTNIDMPHAFIRTNTHSHLWWFIVLGGTEINLIVRSCRKCSETLGVSLPYVTAPWHTANARMGQTKKSTKSNTWWKRSFISINVEKKHWLTNRNAEKKTCYINSAQKHWPTWRNTDKQLLPASENSERKYWRTWRRLNKNICKHQANNINIDLRKVLKNQNITTHQILLKILVHVHWMETLVNVYQVIFDKFGQI